MHFGSPNLVILGHQIWSIFGPQIGSFWDPKLVHFEGSILDPILDPFWTPFWTPLGPSLGTHGSHPPLYAPLGPPPWAGPLELGVSGWPHSGTPIWTPIWTHFGPHFGPISGPHFGSIFGPQIGPFLDTEFGHFRTPNLVILEHRISIFKGPNFGVLGCPILSDTWSEPL